MIKLNSVFKNYQLKNREVVAVKNVSAEIHENEIYGIIGLSGAGKSSLIRMLNRIEEPSGGEIIVNGENILTYDRVKLQKYRQKVGMIFQHFNLLSSRTVEENIAFALEIAKWEKGSIKKRVEELLELVGLQDKATNYPEQLSGGQKQRVAIARALANNPTILLSDEATSALDPKTTKSILELLKEIQRKLGLTIVLITHQMEVIKDVCDRVMVMSQGEAVEIGTVEEIFKNPQSDVSKELIEEIHANDSKEIELTKVRGNKIIKVIFSGESVNKSVISELVRKFDIDISIITGTIDELKNSRIGYLILELMGDIKKQQEAVSWLESQNIQVEVKYNG